MRSKIMSVVACALLASCSGDQTDATSPSHTTDSAAVSTPSPTPASIRGCVPACSTEFEDPGAIEPGPYTTAGFLDGQLTVTYPSAWESHEDQGVEFSSAPKGKWDIHRVLFWNDIIPWVADIHHPAGHRVTGVPNTASGWVQWLRSNPAMIVSAPRDTTIGQMKLPATYVDIAIAPDAPNQDPYCRRFHTVCVALLSWPNAGENLHGWAAPGVLGLYLADVMYGGQTHLLAVAIEGRNANDLRAFLPEAQAVISSAQAPIESAR